MLTVADLTEIARHLPSETTIGHCRRCGMPWPCIVNTLAEEVADLEAALAVETEQVWRAAGIVPWTDVAPVRYNALGAPYDSDTKAEEEGTLP